MVSLGRQISLASGDLRIKWTVGSQGHRNTVWMKCSSDLRKGVVMGHHMDAAEQTEIWNRNEAGETFTEVAAAMDRSLTTVRAGTHPRQRCLVVIESTWQSAAVGVSGSRRDQPRLPRVACTRGCSRPSDTNPKYIGCPSRDVHPPVGVVAEFDAEFFVDGPPVEGVGIGQHGHDVT